MRWTSIPSRGEQKYSYLLHATETEVKCQFDGPLGSQTDLTLLKGETVYTTPGGDAVDSRLTS